MSSGARQSRFTLKTMRAITPYPRSRRRKTHACGWRGGEVPRGWESLLRQPLKHASRQKQQNDLSLPSSLVGMTMVVEVQEWANSQAHFLGRLHSYEPSSCPSRRPKCHPMPGPWYHECRGRPHRSGQNKGHKCQSRLARRDSQVHLHLYHFNQSQPTTHTRVVLLFCLVVG